MSGLPAGLRAAPLAPADDADVTRVWRVCEAYDEGRAQMTHEDLVAATGRPSLCRGRDTVGVRDGDALVAFGVQLAARHTFAHVLPAHRGRGIGRWLMRWTQDAARAAGHAVTGQSVPEHAQAARALLEGDGYTAAREEWQLEIALEREPAPPALPPGYAIRTFIPGRDERAVHALIDTAFSEWPDRDPQPFADWAASALGRPGFSPDQIALAVGRSGARGLYERVGMRVSRTSVEYAKRL